MDRNEIMKNLCRLDADAKRFDEKLMRVCVDGGIYVEDFKGKLWYIHECDATFRRSMADIKEVA
jgi:hypothetical protein